MFKKKGSWGKNAFWPIKGDRISAAIKKNAMSPHVWVPLAGAGVVHLGGYDRPISKSAVKEKTLYHDSENTSHWSDQFNDILLYQMYGTILFTSSMGEDSSLADWAWNKTKGGLVVNMASRTAKITRDQAAKTFKRQRPNRVDYLSLPSGHATDASIRNTLVSKNLDSIDMNTYLRTSIKTINTTMAAGTLWARLEGQRHYPTDVLVGYALGSFVSGVVYDSLMNLDIEETFSIVPLKDQVTLTYTLQF